MSVMPDLMIRGRVSNVALQQSLARAFAVSSRAVMVMDALRTQPADRDTRIYVVHEDLDMPGDFPSWYSIGVSDELAPNFNTAIDRLAALLQMPILTDGVDEETMLLHLPSGEGVLVKLLQDEDDAFLMTPEMKRLIDQATPPVAIAS